MICLITLHMHKELDKRVVITGLGPVTSIGTGRDEFWMNLLDNKSDIRPIPELFKTDYKFKSGFYVPFPSVSIEAFGFESRMNILMEESSKSTLPMNR